MLPGSYCWPATEVLERLVRSTYEGDARAVDALLSTIRPGLLAFFQRRFAADVAEDLTQLALIRIHGALPRIDPTRADSYISTVARNLLRTNQRSSARSRSREGDTDIADVAAEIPSAEVNVEYAELVTAIHRACLANLPPGLREVATAVVRGQDTATIAQDLGVSPITVRTRLMRVRAVLRRELQSYVDLGGENERRRAQKSRG